MEGGGGFSLRRGLWSFIRRLVTGRLCRLGSLVACLRRPHFPVSESGGKGNQGLAPGPLREMAEAVSRTGAREPSALRHPQSEPQKWLLPGFNLASVFVRQADSRDGMTSPSAFVLALGLECSSEPP